MSNEFKSNMTAIFNGLADNIIGYDEALEELEYVLEIAGE